MITLRCGIHLGPRRGPCVLCTTVQAEVRQEVLERQQHDRGAHAAALKRQKRIRTGKRNPQRVTEAQKLGWRPRKASKLRFVKVVRP